VAVRTIWTCDCCGEEIEHKYENGVRSLFEIIIHEEELGDTVIRQDICRDCAIEFLGKFGMESILR
jgi:hypothetical protein